MLAGLLRFGPASRLSRVGGQAQALGISIANRFPGRVVAAQSPQRRTEEYRLQKAERAAPSTRGPLLNAVRAMGAMRAQWEQSISGFVGKTRLPPKKAPPASQPYFAPGELATPMEERGKGLGMEHSRLP